MRLTYCDAQGAGAGYRVVRLGITAVATYAAQRRHIIPGAVAGQPGNWLEEQQVDPASLGRQRYVDVLGRLA